MSYRISLPGNRKTAARLVGSVRRKLVEAVGKSGVSQIEIARKLDVHRSVITRQLKGTADMSIGRAGEIAWAIGLKPEFNLIDPKVHAKGNAPAAEDALPPIGENFVVRKGTGAEPIKISKMSTLEEFAR